MTNFARAFSIHMLTASGAVFAMLALLAAADENWATMYLWLVFALIVDGIDGPLARRFDVKKYAPQWDGVLLDLIVDYLTYVFIPAYALFESGLFPGWTGWISTGVIVFTSAVYFADTRMKTSDNSFSGFPGCWNMVVLVCFAIEPGWVWITIAVLILAVLQFLPVKFIHPVRTQRWRALSLTASIAWVVAGFVCAWNGFQDVPNAVTLVLLVSSLYLLCAGAVQQLTERV